MDGQYLKINNQWHEITQPELWSKSKTEKEYFRTLRDQQKKVPKPDFFIPDSEPGIIPGEAGF